MNITKNVRTSETQTVEIISHSNLYRSLETCTRGSERMGMCLKGIVEKVSLCSRKGEGFEQREGDTLSVGPSSLTKACSPNAEGIEGRGVALRAGGVIQDDGLRVMVMEADREHCKA